MLRQFVCWPRVRSGIEGIPAVEYLQQFGGDDIVGISGRTQDSNPQDALVVLRNYVGRRQEEPSCNSSGARNYSGQNDICEESTYLVGINEESHELIV